MGKKHLIVDYNMIDKFLHKFLQIFAICIEKCDDANILIEADDKLPDDITLKNVIILITCAIKDGDKFYPQILLEEVLVPKKINSISTF